MDPYTADTQAWLDRRFREVDEEGVYYAHQPVYGFRQGPCEGWPTPRYIITYQIMRALSHLRFSSLLDIGGAEGYKSALARKVFGADVTSCDLSEEACHRAMALYGVPGRSVDIHALPFADGEFDVVLCSETLEHVSRIQEATMELLRVARRAVIITVPREPIEVVERNIREKVPHGHIHALDPTSFDFTRPTARRIHVRRLLTAALTKAFSIADALPKPQAAGLRGRIVAAFNHSLPLLQRVISKGAVGRLIELDDRLANTGLPYLDMIFTLIKDESAYSATPLVEVSPADVLDFSVPLHRPTNGVPRAE